MSSGADPFVDSDGERSYYVTSTLRQRIDLVRHLLEFGRQIVVLSGAAGSGKSGLLDQITFDADNRWELVRLTGGPTLSRQALLGRIAGELGIDDTGDGSAADVLRTIRMYIAAAGRRGETTLLALDDADALPADTTSCLTDLAHSTNADEEMKVLLTADPGGSSIVERLRNETTDQSLLHVIEIPALTAEQTHEMLAYRWQAAYGEVEFPFETVDTTRIHRQANGNPGRTIVLARQVQRLADDPARVERDPAQRFLLLGVLAIAVIAIIAMINARRTNAPEELADSETSASVATGGKTTVVPLTLPGSPPAAAPDESVSAAPLPVPPISNAPPVVGEESAAPPAPVSDSAATNANATPAEEPPARAPGAASAGTRSEPATPPTASVVPTPAAATAPKPEQAARPAPNEPPPSKPAAAKPEPATPEPAKAAREITTTSPAAATPAASASAPAYSLAWLRQQARGSYVLQLFGVRDRIAASRFIERHGIGGKSTIFTTEHAGGPWYVVVYGLYPTRAAAQAAVATLPREIAASSPWARPVESLD